MQLNEKIFKEINGIKQGMFLQSDNTENPVLLYLHGGPGSPAIAFNEKYPTGLEKIFTVCWWEQRGSGITYSKHTPIESMTVEQMIKDAIAVTDYLCKRFGKQKIYVMGHSWGSVLGILTVQRAPQMFYAYIGMGQVARQEQSERLAYTFMLKEFNSLGDKKMIRKLEKFPIDKGGEITTKYLSSIREKGMLKLGVGIMHSISSMKPCVKAVLGFKGYTFSEKNKFIKGGSFSLKCFWDFVMQNDFSKLVPDLDIPVYVMQGKYDYQVSYVVAKEFIETLKAPIKGFYTFENSAHSPCFEEPEKMIRILTEDVLRGKVDLADKNI